MQILQSALRLTLVSFHSFSYVQLHLPPASTCAPFHTHAHPLTPLPANKSALAAKISTPRVGESPINAASASTSTLLTHAQLIHANKAHLMLVTLPSKQPRADLSSFASGPQVAAAAASGDRSPRLHTAMEGWPNWNCGRRQGRGRVHKIDKILFSYHKKVGSTPVLSGGGEKNEDIW